MTNKFTNERIAGIFALVIICILCIVGLWYQHNQLHDKDMLIEELISAYVGTVDSESPAQQFETIWTITYNSIDLPKIGELDEQIRQKHSAACKVEVELKKVNTTLDFSALVTISQFADTSSWVGVPHIVENITTEEFLLLTSADYNTDILYIVDDGELYQWQIIYGDTTLTVY